MTVTTVDVTTTRPRGTGDRDRLYDRRGVLAPRARGVAFALPGLCPTADIVLPGPVRLCSPSTTPLPIGPVAMALFLAGNSVAELGRKAEVGDVGGERHPVRVPRGTQTA